MLEKNHLHAENLVNSFLKLETYSTNEITQRRKTFCVQTVYYSRQFALSYENRHWRKPVICSECRKKFGQQDFSICIWDCTLEKCHLHVVKVVNSLISLEAWLTTWKYTREKNNLYAVNVLNSLIKHYHIKIHDREKRFTFRECSKFNQAGSLAHHMTIHMKSLKCGECTEELKIAG